MNTSRHFVSAAAITILFSIAATVITINTLCIEYCLETWSGEEWNAFLCVLICFIPGAQIAPLAAIVTACIV